MWVSQKAAPELIGKPLSTGFPFNLVSSLRIDKLGGYDHCGSNATKWAAFAGDPNYNLLNEWLVLLKFVRFVAVRHICKTYLPLTSDPTCVTQLPGHKWGQSRGDRLHHHRAEEYGLRDQ